MIFFMYFVYICIVSNFRKRQVGFFTVLKRKLVFSTCHYTVQNSLILSCFTQGGAIRKVELFRQSVKKCPGQSVSVEMRGQDHINVL